MGPGRNLVGYRCPQVGPRTCPVSSVGLSFGIPEPLMLNELSSQWFGMILDG